MSARRRHYEFAEDERKTYGIFAGRTHGSAPTADGEDWWGLIDIFSLFFVVYFVKVGKLYVNSAKMAMHYVTTLP